jgi:hypothetical protein
MLPLFPKAPVLKHPITDVRGNIARRFRVFHKNTLKFKCPRNLKSLL